MRHLGWVLAAALLLSSCGPESADETPPPEDEPTAAAVEIPAVASDSREEAEGRLDAARDLVVGDNTISLQLTANGGRVGSITSASVVDLGDQESEGTATFDDGLEGPFTVEMRALGARFFARPQNELCWFDYGELEDAVDPWFPTALMLGTEAVAVGVSATDESQVVAEVSALVAVSAVTRTLATSLPPEAQDTGALVPVLVTLDDDGRLTRTAFNYEDALDALVADGIDLSVVAQDDPDLAGASTEDLRDSLAGPYVTTYTPTFGLDVEAPAEGERIDFFALDQSDPDAPVGCDVSP